MGNQWALLAGTSFDARLFLCRLSLYEELTLPFHCRLPGVVQSYMPVGGAYFASERSFAQFRLPESCACLVGFAATPCTLLLISHTGD